MLKQRLVGTRLGDWAIAGRSRLELVQAALSANEALGTMVNDQIAAHLLVRLCADHRTFIDVGSHIGSIVDAVARHSGAGRIVAVEAIPEKAAALTAKFPGVEVHACALGEEEGETLFYVDDARTGYSSLDDRLQDRSASVRRITVPLRRLDDIVDADGVDVVKIDVEGAELGVLIGAQAILARSRPTIMFESGAESMADYSKKRMWTWLDEHDYAVVLPNRVAHDDPGMSLTSFEESHLYPRFSTNYFAIYRPRRIEIRDRARRLLSGARQA